MLEGAKLIALNLENENVGLGVLQMAENGGDPGDLPPVGGFPDLREEIARSASPEAILSELSSCVERIFSEVGTAIPLGECQSVREFTETMVLWHGEGGETLNEIFLDYIEAGPESEFVAVATNLARKFRHAERGEPDTPDPHHKRS